MTPPLGAHAYRRHGRHGASRAAAAVVTILVALPGIASAAGADASAAQVDDATDMVTYEPYRMVHSVYTPDEVDRFLAELDAYGIDQALLQTPKLHSDGVLRVPKPDRMMLATWASQAESYNDEHGTHLAVVAIVNGEVKTDRRGLDLDDPVTRANLVAGVESVLTTGVHGVHLDLEPYPTTTGFVTLLEELNDVFAQHDYHGRLSTVAPGHTRKWTPEHLRQVSEQVSQLNPLFYDSGHRASAAYQHWIVRSLRHYTTYAAADTKIIPVIPASSANPWHRPRVENIATATAALEDALAAGSRVNGAGIWWWYGFFYDEDGHYDASADRAAWRERTVHLPFSP